MKENKVSIFIPYNQTDNGEKLRLALRSIEKNCKFDYEVILVGDCPDWVNKETLVHINPKIPAAAEYQKAWNGINKLKFLLENYEMSELLMTYDDIIFLKEVKYKDISKPIALAQLPDSVRQLTGTSSAKWREVLQYTIDALKRNNLPSLNFETHLPRLFNAEKLREMISLFGFQKRPYLFPTLYFNWLNPKQKPVVLAEIPNQKIKAGIYYPSDFEKYLPVLEEYTYLNWSEEFWAPKLENVLLGLFPEQSKYEKPAIRAEQGAVEEPPKDIPEPDIEEMTDEVEEPDVVEEHDIEESSAESEEPNGTDSGNTET